MGHPIEDFNATLSLYHYWIFFLLFTYNVPLYWHSISQIFITAPMDFYCNGTNTNDTKNYCPCDNPWWDRSVYTETMQSKFGIYCDTEWKQKYAAYLISLGSIYGAFAFGLLADRYGRVPTITINMFCMGLFGLLGSVATTFHEFLFFSWGEGICTGGSMVTTYVLMIEYCGINNRVQISTLFNIPINIAQVTVPWISCYFKHCDEFLMAISVPLFLWLVMHFHIKESPRWLVDTGQIDKCNKTIEKIFKFNIQSSDEIKTAIQIYQEGRTVEKEEFCYIFTSRLRTKNFLRLGFQYFSCGIGFYGIYQYVNDNSELYRLHVSLSGATLIISTLLATFLINFMSRKSFLMTSNFLACAIMLNITLLPADIEWPKVILACLCSSFYYIIFIVTFLYGIELYPTTVRSSALGVLSVFAKCGKMCAPLLGYLNPDTARIIFVMLPLLTAVILVPLPETKDKPLPNTVTLLDEEEED